MTIGIYLAIKWQLVVMCVSFVIRPKSFDLLLNKIKCEVLIAQFNGNFINSYMQKLTLYDGQLQHESDLR